MPAIDIPVSLNLQRLFKLPPCQDISLPSPKPLAVQLPMGGSLKAFSDISKGIPSDCSLTFSLLVQIAPLLGSFSCLFKVLKLIKPLIDVINGLPIPPVKAIQEFAKAAVDLAPCLLAPTPAALIPFIRDILCLILKVLQCFLSQMNSIVSVLDGLQLQIQTAQNSGNSELLSALQCAQSNAQVAGQNVTQSIEPIGVILDLVGPLMGIAGVQPIQLPKLGPQADVAALKQTLQTMQGVVATIQAAVDLIGGCPG